MIQPMITCETISAENILLDFVLDSAPVISAFVSVISVFVVWKISRRDGRMRQLELIKNSVASFCKTGRYMTHNYNDASDTSNRAKYNLELRNAEIEVSFALAGYPVAEWAEELYGKIVNYYRHARIKNKCGEPVGKPDNLAEEAEKMEKEIRVHLGRGFRFSILKDFTNIGKGPYKGEIQDVEKD